MELKIKIDDNLVKQLWEQQASRVPEARREEFTKFVAGSNYSEATTTIIKNNDFVLNQLALLFFNNFYQICADEFLKSIPPVASEEGEVNDTNT